MKKLTYSLVRVTRFQYPLESSWVEVLDLVTKRVTNKKRKRDAVLLFEGDEGIGKSTFSIASAYYLSEQTGRKFDASQVFFDSEKLSEAIQKKSGEIFVWDEPALNMLSMDRSKAVSDMIRLLMMARKKRHIILINITYFNKFKDYIIAERPVGMVKIYDRPSTGQSRFIFIPKKYLSYLWRDWQTKKRKNYFKYGSKKCRGSFPDILNPDYKYNVLEEFDLELYDNNKDEAINAVGKKKVVISKTEEKLQMLQWRFYEAIKKSPITLKDVAKDIGVDDSTMVKWGDLPDKNPKLLEKWRLKVES